MDPLSAPLDTLVLSYRGIFSLATLSHLWTWVAILSAAISLWRITTSANPSVRKTQPHSPEIVSGTNEWNGPRPSPPSCSQTHPSPRTAPSAAVTDGSATFRRTQIMPSEPAGSFTDWEGEEDEDATNTRMETSQTDVDRERRDSDSVDTDRLGCVLCERGRGRFAVYFDGKRRAGDGNENKPAVEKNGFPFLRECNTTVHYYWELKRTTLMGHRMTLAAEWPWCGGLDLTALNGNVVRLWESRRLTTAGGV